MTRHGAACSASKKKKKKPHYIGTPVGREKQEDREAPGFGGVRTEHPTLREHIFQHPFPTLLTTGRQDHFQRQGNFNLLIVQHNVIYEGCIRELCHSIANK